MILEKISHYINLHALLQPGDEVVVALSGGADSVALLVTLYRLGYHVTAAHCNFHLRGPESDRDMDHCRALCSGLGIRLLIKHFDVKARMDATGESVEMACRSLRYEWFDEILDLRPRSLLAVAHHRDDNVETFFLNALRGSGIAGLRGMLPRSRRIIRPMLAVTRQEIEQFLEAENFPYITDSSNKENVYRRNRLRNIIIPQLEQSFPGASSRISTTIGHLRDDDILLNDYDTELLKRYVDVHGVIDIASVIASHPHPRQVLYRLLRDTDVPASSIDEILSHPQSAGLTYSSYTLDRGKLRPIIRHHLDIVNVTPGKPPLMMRRISPEDFHPINDPARIWLDATALDGNPRWQLRPWHKGDRFKPFGMTGTKKISDLFARHKLDENAKRLTPLLTRNDEIIWVTGLRASRLFPVTPSTTEIIELTLIKPEDYD